MKSQAKQILAAYSEVFEKMFDSMFDLNETENNKVIIEDIEYEVMYTLVKFMYTTKIEFENFDFALDVWTAADKYNVIPLKQVCERCLVLNVENENAVLALQYAIKFKMPKLLAKASELVSRASESELSNMMN